MTAVAMLGPGTSPQWRDVDVEISMRRKTLIALLGTLLIHALLFWAIRGLQQKPKVQPVGGKSAPIYLQLDKLPPPPPEAEPEPAPQKSEPPPRPQKPKTVERRLPRPTRPTITAPSNAISIPTPSPIVAAEPPPAPPPATPATPAAPAPLPGEDMAAYIARRKAERGATPSEPSEDEIRMAKIRRNLQPEGTSGVFEITSRGMTTAQFSFRGWNNHGSNTHSQLINVEVGGDGDIEHAIVRRMIALIRQYYTGDFNWESQRMGRTLSLSARREDNAGLEEFLMKEFFGSSRGR